MERQNLSVATRGRGTYDITEKLQSFVAGAGTRQGLCHLFVRHTSASLIICENADPDVRRDLEMVLQRLAPDGDPAYRHDCEGPDDMPAHVRTVLTQSSLTLPVENGRLDLGTWQGVYLYEHRYHPQHRTVVLSVFE